ncbi:flagellar motor protein MotB [Halomonas sp. McH1-25]|uniref:flagellar motor protein MotB n=1 Tax=unclassified Halomonas TaxID=2609666 RepID=UPI001EF6F4B0|nr:MULTISPECIES: flagellar motor protein MotB [unclassified Halomonas]MCG7598613.1 flagellar motor protein MotB [Halomonas sp. McH1-25]MCP1342309.1 flagellar motor protein MotB [Halomonas sp. FL8]MCP1360644.1 flagellar motor protein MotB [Halomonas sp. BBD45]
MSGAHRPIVIKRKKSVKGGHHGGAWKIAYADFMTALMALFLVLWLLSTASPAELKSISEYFRTPLPVAMAGGDKNTASTSAIPGGGPDPAHVDGEQMRVDRRQETRPSDEQRRLINLEKRIESVIESKPNLRELRSQLRMAMTPEGLRIQIVDSERRPMFELGSDRVAPYMHDILHAIAPVLNELPNRISLSGHTDSLPYVNGEKGYSNWELSADRANASRRELVAGGLDAEKLLRVAGMGARVPLAEVDGSDAANRRISILVLDKRAAQSITEQSVQTWSEAPPKIAPPAGANVPEESAVVAPNMALESLNDAFNAP